MPQAVAAGGDGGVNGGANLFPKLFVEAFRAADQGDRARVAECTDAIEQLQGIYAIGKYASRVIKAIKSGLSIRGICNDQLAEPFNRFHSPERARVEAVLAPLIQAGW
jgi:4-hydroxy-tetrahydrodipicolinate synthase